MFSRNLLRDIALRSLCWPILLSLHAAAQAAPSRLVDVKAGGGLAVHVGATDTSVAAHFAGSGRWLTLLLPASAETADGLRAQVARKKLAGWVTVAAFDGALPLADHMANVIVVESSTKVAETEILRALVPVRGQAFLSGGRTLTKPMPASMDGWTHFFHSASGNKVSRDTAIRVPDGLRFIAGPRLQDRNGGNGWRLDRGIATAEWNYTLHDKDHPQLVVEARDAFNGALLWQEVEAVPRGGRGSGKTKPFILSDGRLLRIADDGKVAKIAAVDPETGRTLRVYDSSLNIRGDRYAGRDQQFTYHDGRIYQADERNLVCFDAETDEVKWRYEHDRGLALTRPIVAAEPGLLIVGDSPGWRRFENQERRINLFSGRYPGTQVDALLAFDLETGRKAWTCEAPAELRDFDRVEVNPDKRKAFPNKAKLHAIAYHAGRVFGLFACDANWGNPSVIWSVDATSGTTLWVAACGPVGSKWRQRFDMFLLDDGTLFTYGHGWSRMDQATGKLLAIGNSGGNARCDTGACTVNLVTAGFGNYFDLASDQLRWTKRDLARGQCGGWGTPAYGMMYYHGSGCGCFFPLRGNLALHHAPAVEPIPDAERLTRGPATSTKLGAGAAAADWPAYLYNGQRRAWAPNDGPRGLKEAWRLTIGEPIAPDVRGVRQDWLNCGIYNGPVLAPVIAGGRVFTADRDRHRGVAVDARSGQLAWGFQAGGRVLTTPTYSRGRVVFGARDGYVYCLDAATGELAWRFFAAPRQRFLLAYGQIESVWPVHGCLPVLDGTVVATAGYHGEADGGVWAWGLDLASGEIRWSRRLNRPLRDWKTFEPKKESDGQVVYRVKDDEHPLASRNQSNGSYHPTKVRNIDLPFYDDEVAEVGLQALVAATGEPSERGVKDRMVIVGERYPFLDMESEYRSGPHGTGWIGLRFGEIDFRDGYRVAHDGRQVMMIASGRDHTKGPGLFLIDPVTAKPDRWGRVVPRERTPFAHAVKTVGRGADSLALGGNFAYVASEGHLIRPWGAGERPRRRWRKGEAIPGHLEVFDLARGERIGSIELDAAVINNGLAVAAGRLYAVCEDGTLRCYE